MTQNAEATTAKLVGLRELERCIEHEVGLVERDGVTAFFLDPGELGVAVEIGSGLEGLVKPDALAESIAEALRERCGLSPRVIALLPAGQLPRTRLGRRQRFACARRFSEGTLGAIAVYRGGVRDAVASDADRAAVLHDASPSGAGGRAPVELATIEAELGAIWREVLGLAEVAPKDSFFALGGSSLAAAQMVARAEQRLGVRSTAAALFEAPTLGALARYMQRALASGAERLRPIPRVSRAGRLALSPTQRRMRFAWELDRESGAYNVSGALRLRGPLGREALGRAFLTLVERHEALRTCFPEHAGDGYQHIDERVEIAIDTSDLRALPSSERDAQLSLALAAEAARPFDLARGPLLRVRLFELDVEDHALLVTLHHAVVDGASMNILLDELARAYAAHLRGERPALASLPVQYADYAAWQAGELDAGLRARQLEHWTRELAGADGVLELPADRPRPAAQTFAGRRLDIELPAGLIERVRAHARARDASPFMLLLAAFDVLLARVAGQHDVRVGIPLANRSRVEAERLLGAFINTAVVRVSVNEAESFDALLDRVRRAVSGAQQHQDLPFDELVEALAPERSLGHSPLFQVMYNHQPRALGALGELPGLRAEVIDVESPVTRFDLSLTTEEDDRGRWSAAFTYAADLFDRERVERLARQLVTLLDGLLARPSLPLREVEWLGAGEREQLLALGFERAPAPPAGCVHEWIAERARERPDAVALCDASGELTYRELARRTSELAAELGARGAGPDVVVGIAIERSFEMVVAVLAALQAGAAYLPLDPEYPARRLAQMIDDASARLVLCREALPTAKVAAALERPERVEFVDVDRFAAESRDASQRATEGGAGPRRAAAAASAASKLAVHGENLAYVLYTSGTTGRPKGVMNTHAALGARLAWMQREYALAPSETLLHKTPLSFDVSVWELLWPLAQGARVVLAAPGEQRDPRRLAQLIQAYDVSTVHFVPSLWREFVAEPEASRCSSLRRVFSGGEALSSELMRAVSEALPGARFDNRYGPTEALINASYWTCRADHSGAVPIGRSIPGTALRILDAELRPVPVGVAGELYIGEGGLARGYAGRATLTAERFVPDPFASAPGGRLYRTGDQARFLADGHIEYVGRRDEQVKVRGVRIELGELESALVELDGVRAAAAAARPGPGGVVRLVAYVTAEPRVDAPELERALRERLPAHLVPASIVLLDALPRLPSGKLDRAALPDPTWLASDYVAPRSELELALAATWREVLGLERVGLSDDFFALGGNSLLATRLVSRVRAAFDLDLPLRDLFEAPELGAFAARVRQALDADRKSRQPALVPADRGERLPLSYAQERMWFLWHLAPESAAYNVGGAVKLRGRLDVPALERALEVLVERHESLRTTFPREGGAPVQRIAPRADVRMIHSDLSTLDVGARARQLVELARHEAEAPFDLETGPLLRVRLVRLAAEEHLLLITLHHIMAEGWAMDVFAREYAALYQASSEGRSIELPPLAVQYADYAAW
ncbi:MAG TPA: amino acid adenylation domain-containing protein, partial [Polyangiaceae bacterium]|nr:amino acid adenylation domain-containing protein [Polyangiaceae bacterium]